VWRVCNLTAERRQKKQKRTRETCRSRKFAAAHRGIIRFAGVTRRMGSIVGKNQTTNNVATLTQKGRTEKISWTGRNAKWE
jgi:hypothetical protein